MSSNDLDNIDLDCFFDANVTEQQLNTDKTINTRKTTIDLKRNHLKKLKAKNVAEILTELPAPGWSTHIVSKGNFDYFDFAPRIIDLLGGWVDESYFCTWSINRHNTVELIRLIDEGRIKRFNLLTGDYFKNRERDVYHLALNAMLRTGNRIKTIKAHAKVLIFRKGETRICFEGSANLTHNPRIEQYFVAQCPELYEHHRSWMEEAFDL